MSGIIGIINPTLNTRDFRTGASLMLHTPFLKYAEFNGSDKCRLAAIHHPSQPLSHTYQPQAQLEVVLIGIANQDVVTSTRLNAEDIFDIYLAGGLAKLSNFNGHFLGLIYDGKKNTTIIFNDRVAALQLFYTVVNGQLVFAPEAKFLLKFMNPTPKMDLISSLHFINNEYLFGDESIFQNIHRLEPAHILKFNGIDLSLVVEPYWIFTFDVDKKMNLAEGSDELYQEIERSHRYYFEAENNPLNLMMTGGFDSRGILGTLVNINRRPDRMTCFGNIDNIPYSDPTLARQMASAYDIDFKFYGYNTDYYFDNLRSWNYIGELLNDNAGNYAAGKQFLLDHNENKSYITIIGDQLFGWGGYPVSVQSGIAEILRLPFNLISTDFSNILKSNSREEVFELTQRQVKRIISRCRNSNPKDIKDYLGLYIEMHGWLCSPTFFRDPIMHVIRPFLTSNILDFIQTVPQIHRVDKKLYVNMLHSHMSDLMSYPKASVNSLIDWELEIKREGKMRDKFIECLATDRVMATPIGIFIDPEKYTSYIKNYFATPIKRESREYSWKYNIYYLRRILSVSNIAARTLSKYETHVKRMLGWSLQREKYKLIQRLVSYVLFCEEFYTDLKNASNNTNNANFTN